MGFALLMLSVNYIIQYFKDFPPLAEASNIDDEIL